MMEREREGVMHPLSHTRFMFFLIYSDCDGEETYVLHRCVVMRMCIIR